MPTIKLRRGSRDQWTTSNPILADGEIGVELDTGLLKVGNGFQHWDHLPYFYPNVSRLDLVRLEDRINQGLSEMVMEDISDVAFTTLQDGEAIVWSVDPVRGDAFRNINLDSKYALQNRIGNLLTPNQASVETPGAVGAQGGWAPSDAVKRMEYSTDFALHGTGCLKLTALTTASVTFGAYGNTASYAAVNAGATYTASVQVRSAASGRSGAVYINWVSATGTSLSSSPVTVVPLKESEWTLLTTTVKAPAGAAYARVMSAVYYHAVDDGFYYDCFGFWEGAGGDWAMPGTPILNQGSRVSRPNGTDKLVEVWDGASWMPTHYDSGWRDIPFDPAVDLPVGAKAHIRRFNTMVTLRIMGTFTQVYSPMLTLPQGFRTADTGGTGYTQEGWNGWAFRNRGQADPYGLCDGHSVITYKTFEFSVEHMNDIPTSLPGTMVTQAD